MVGRDKLSEENQWKQEAIENYTRPWGERRGLESLPSNDDSILVKASIDELADVLESIALESRKDILGSSIDVTGCFFLTYQLVGQHWSTILIDQICDLKQLKLRNQPIAAVLSAILGKPVIQLLVRDNFADEASNTVGAIGYRLFNHGEIVEYFQGSDDDNYYVEIKYGLNIERHVWDPYPQVLEYPRKPRIIHTAYFGSCNRQITTGEIEEIGPIWEFVDRFLKEQDAYDLAIDTSYFLDDSDFGRGQRYQISNPGSTLVLGNDETFGQNQGVKAIPDFVRVDYFRFGT
ncbi:MAG: hypothetical protein KTR27_09740 [Leptolyngbyaceae cyanobacterium MAG.088]|nr:hypothetical protein [Leptolyngbyaceae cyanobacterium MAG.088]